MSFLRNKRVLAIIGIVCLFIGTVMPYYQFSLLGYTYSISLWKYWEGKAIVALLVINTMFIFKDVLMKYVPSVFNSSLGQKIENASPKLSIIPTILVVAFVLYLTFSSDYAHEYLKYGLGFYSLWLGIVCLVGHTIFYKKQSNIETNNYQSIQQPYQQPMNMQQPINSQPVSNNQPMNNQQFAQQPMNQQPMSMQQPINNQTSGKKSCPQCGNLVDSNVTMCFMCGHKF